MKHSSVLKLNSPIEFIESTKISPFISKVLIKVCYVGDEPNRNGSIITKDVAREMAPSLRGCPIVGFFNEKDEDFEEHNRQIDISGGEWKITDTTTPYGFVSTDAKIWFATYIDDEQSEHEYLCTEGYIWDHVYPETKRIKTNGNNQSMELDEETLKADWTKDKNSDLEFFIINEAFVEKLCILGENFEPCFEGSQITSFSLVIDESFKQKMFAMINEVKELITEGGAKVFTTYAVEIGDALWSALYSYIESTYPDGEDRWCSKYSIDGIFEENGQKFAILRNRAEMKYYRLNFSLTEADGFKAEDNLVEVTKTYTPATEPQFAAADVEAYIAEYAKKKDEEEEEKGKSGKGEEKKSEDNPEDKKSDDDDEDKEEKKKNKKYSYDTLEEIPEYVELQTNYSNLEAQVATLNTTIEGLNSELTSLRKFKSEAERVEKEAKIAEFYMLSDEDKKDVIDNIDKYSLDDIEAKLSVICFRNKVSFKTEEGNSPEGPTTYNLNGDEGDDSSTPAWVRAAINTAKTLN